MVKLNTYFIMILNLYKLLFKIKYAESSVECLFF
jgi:hypothetical protein